MQLKEGLMLLGWISIATLPGIIGSQFEPGLWYETLQKPSWTPPNWIFPIVWPILYFLIGVSAWLLWRQFGITNNSIEYSWYFLQLVLNGLWSWIFFGKNLIGWGLVEIIILLITIGVTAYMFGQKHMLAGLLLLPYLLWVSYASALNFAIWQLN